jgi:hypothetical protein
MGKQRLKGFGNVEMRKIFWHKRKEVTGGWKNCMRNFIICTTHQILLK